MNAILLYHIFFIIKNNIVKSKAINFVLICFIYSKCYIILNQGYSTTQKF